MCTSQINGEDPSAFDVELDSIEAARPRLQLEFGRGSQQQISDQSKAQRGGAKKQDSSIVSKDHTQRTFPSSSADSHYDTATGDPFEVMDAAFEGFFDGVEMESESDIEMEEEDTNQVQIYFYLLLFFCFQIESSKRKLREEVGRSKNMQ